MSDQVDSQLQSFLGATRKGSSRLFQERLAVDLVQDELRAMAAVPTPVSQGTEDFGWGLLGLAAPQSWVGCLMLLALVTLPRLLPLDVSVGDYGQLIQLGSTCPAWEGHEDPGTPLVAHERFRCPRTQALIPKAAETTSPPPTATSCHLLAPTVTP